MGTAKIQLFFSAKNTVSRRSKTQLDKGHVSSGRNSRGHRQGKHVSETEAPAILHILRGAKASKQHTACTCMHVVTTNYKKSSTRCAWSSLGRPTPPVAQPHHRNDTDCKSLKESSKGGGVTLGG
eukprot:360783-Chlamydomonas_euryale.AAC.7